MILGAIFADIFYMDVILLQKSLQTMSFFGKVRRLSASDNSELVTSIDVKNFCDSFYKSCLSLNG